MIKRLKQSVSPRLIQTVRTVEENGPAEKCRTKRFWSEPFRPFFLLGWAISLLALALWPLFFLGWTDGFPARPHAFLMIQGFFGAFAIGFLWTALPRMLEVSGPGPGWIGAGLLLIAANAMLHLGGAHLAGHTMFLLLIALMATFAWTRFPERRDLPPPSFILVLMGMGAGIIGTGLVALGEAGVALGYGYGFGRVLLMDIFLLCLVMGVSAFIAPRFLEQKSKQSVPENRTPGRAWKNQAALAGAAGAILFLGAAIQAAGSVRLGSLIIAAPVTGYILFQVPLWRRPSHLRWMAVGLRIALLCAIAAPWLRFAVPDARVAAAHLLMMGGFGLLTLVIGARVVFGHSGYGHLFRARLPSVGILTALYLLALVLRLTAEFAGTLWTPLLITSALLLLVAHGMWAFIALPKILAPRHE